MNELYHHGILGMKWGIRRYQNEDGTLTAEGKKRYSNKEIKQYRNERTEYHDKHGYAKIEEKQNQIRDKAYAIAKKYGLDMDDGGGGDTSKYSDKELYNASLKYLNLWEDYYDLESQAERYTYEKTTQDLLDKYGEQRMKEFDRSEAVKTGAICLAAMGVIAAPGLAMVISDLKK